LEFLYGIDKAVFLFFNARLSHPVLDCVMPHITEFRFWIIPGLLAAALFVFRERKKALIALGLVALTAALCDPLSSHVLKNLFARPRPCNPDAFVEGGRFLLGMRQSFSFPSSHSMSMFSIATVLFCFYPKRGVYFYAFAAMIGYSRVYCGVHYPADVLGGAVFGSLLGWGVYAGYLAAIRMLKSKSKSNNNTKGTPPLRGVP
jgi:undecaprenyl-diphosphatase